MIEPAKTTPVRLGLDSIDYLAAMAHAKQRRDEPAYVRAGVLLERHWRLKKFGPCDPATRH